MTTPMQKRISLKFDGLPADRVRQIASATTGLPGKDPRIQLLAELARMDNDRINCTQMVSVGASYLHQISETIQSLNIAVDDLVQRSAPSSLLGSLLGKRRPVAQQEVDSVARLLDSCNAAIENLNGSVAKSRATIHNRQGKAEVVLVMARAMGGEEGVKLGNRISECKAAFEKHAEDMRRISETAGEFTQSCLDAGAQIDKIAKAQRGLKP